VRAGVAYGFSFSIFMGLIVTEQILGATCERFERATMVALDLIVFFPAPI
jgi:hypothetical protein